jgi:ketosteroid isomerase-like protein
MNTSTRRLPLFVTMALFAVSAVGKTSSPAEPATTFDSQSSEVLAAADAIVAAFGRHDTKAYFALFPPEATFVFHNTRQRLNSRAEYEAEWARWEKDDGFRVLSCRSTNRKVQIFGDMAVFSHSVRTELSTKQGDSTVLERETIVFDRRGDKWVAVHEHVSPDPGQQ